MSDIVIRRAAPDDAAALSLVGRATLLETYATLIGFADMLAFARGGHSEAAYQAFLDDPACAVWLAETPTAVPVGFALVTQPDLPVETDTADIELRRIYMLSKFHGGGLGRALIERALTHVREAGFKRLLIGVKEDNHRAIGFYRRMGGEQIGTRRFLVGETLFDDLIFAIGV